MVKFEYIYFIVAKVTSKLSTYEFNTQVSINEEITDILDIREIEAYLLSSMKEGKYDKFPILKELCDLDESTNVYLVNFILINKEVKMKG